MIVSWFSCTEKKDMQPVRLREIINFNDGWLFKTDSLQSGIRDHWENTGFTDARKVSLPHTWNVMHGLENYAGWGWYRKEFTIPGTWKGKIVKLRFNAIYHDATIWVNGREIMKHSGSGYTPFEVYLNGTIRYDSLNTVTVLANNSFTRNNIPVYKSFDWANDGGIIRDVTLIKSEPLSMRRVLITPAFKADGSGTVNIRISLDTLFQTISKRVDVWYRIALDDDIAASGNEMIGVDRNTIVLNVDIDAVKLWSFDHPQLYDIKLAIGNDFSLSDNFAGTFGFRDLEPGGDKLSFNGEPVRLPGLEWMPGSDSLQGMAEDTVTMYKMLGLLKNTNAVMTRFHWQQDEKILDWCDRNGLLVQEELPLWSRPFPGDLNDTIRNIAWSQAEEMVLNHYNHPSVISWGIGNELRGGNDTIISFLDQLKVKVLSLDSTRLVNYVSNTLQNDPGHDATIHGDLMMWNDYTGLWYSLGDHPLTDRDDWRILNNIHQSNPGKSLVISEYGLCEPFFKGGDPRRIRHMIYHTSIYDTLDYISGVIYFCLNDYRTHMGEQVTGRIRERVHGITDTQGNKKPSYDTLKAIFSPVRSVQFRRSNRKLIVTGLDHDGLPSYSLSGYSAQLVRQRDGVSIEELPLPDVQPGNKFNLVFDDPGIEEYQLIFLSPTRREIAEFSPQTTHEN